ncbi:ATP-grasp domain-containing protein [Larkinella sp.]|uniref:ATP-grasp domain-containing protein n=1 Tax=Larkinella sp. TaxID=2034517 RepID=UPI003BAAF21F
MLAPFSIDHLYISALQRTANIGDFRANLSRGGSGHVIKLTNAEKEMCVKAAKAVGLEFAGVDLIRELGTYNSVYVTEVNGNPGTGIIDLTGYNHFKDLVAYLELKTGNTATTATTTPETTTTTEKTESEAHQYPLEYLTLAILERDNKKLPASQSGLLAFYKQKYGHVNV